MILFGLFVTLLLILWCPWFILMYPILFVLAVGIECYKDYRRIKKCKKEGNW